LFARARTGGDMTRPAARSVFLGIAIALSACAAVCGGGSSSSTNTSPTGPTSTPATLRSVAVSCTATTLSSFGQTTQCSLNATMSTGQGQDQTASATWSSSASTVASVNGAGLVTAN